MIDWEAVPSHISKDKMEGARHPPGSRWRVRAHPRASDALAPDKLFPNPVDDDAAVRLEIIRVGLPAPLSKQSLPLLTAKRASLHHHLLKGAEGGGAAILEVRRIQIQHIAQLGVERLIG